jgi:hypothetical protein
MVPSDAASSAYRVAAENVPGVRKVKNHMRRVPAAVGMGIYRARLDGRNGQRSCVIGI